jgi:signal transduction histidine kinase
MVKFSSQLEQKSFQVGFENEELKQIFSKNINLLQEKLEEAPIFINPDHYEVNKQDTNLNDFILHFFNDISEAFPDREQDLRLINPDTNTFCSLDPILTRKTLENFIYNSVKYSPKSSDISVSCSETDKDIKISVKDFGIGFTSQELDSLQNLNPGKQARFSPDKAQGSGFGLYNAISYALNQGAYVEVSSSGKDIGLGSTFSIVFPK